MSPSSAAAPITATPPQPDTSFLVDDASPPPLQRPLRSDGLSVSSVAGQPAVPSRPGSAQSVRIRVERPGLPAGSDGDNNGSANGRATGISAPGVASAATGTRRMESSTTYAKRTGGSIEDAERSPLIANVFSPRPTRYTEPTLFSRLRLEISQLIANAISSSFLILVVVWALTVRALAAVPASFVPRIVQERDWDDRTRWKKEALVKDVRYYATSCGFEIVNETVETEDGYLLRVNRVVCPGHKIRADRRGGYPVLIMHGLFQSSGSFVTSEDRSLAFWLARHGGYQVFLGNNRGVFDMGHKRYSRNDPRFWDYDIRELAKYDLRALVEYVCKTTGYDKIAFIGHSQGNATAFVALSRGMVPELGEKLSIFVALAPAVYAGPLTSCFPFTALRRLDWKRWKRIFGVLDFIPLMRVSYDWTPALPYALLGYQMFAFLFAWTDANWLPRRKAKMFRFTPQPVSSASIFWWAGKRGFASRGCILDPDEDRWFDRRFPPLALYSGGMDFLVLTEPLLKRLEEREKDVRLVRAVRQETAEHCDHFWAADSVEWCFHTILEDIENTRPRFPEEEEASRIEPARVA